MQFKKISKSSFLTVMFSFFGLLFFSNIDASACVKIDTRFVDKGIIDLSCVKGNDAFDGTFWRGEKLELPREYAQILRLIDGMYISKSSDLYKTINELATQLVSMDIEKDYLVQLYQDGELNDDQLIEEIDKVYSPFESLQKRIIDSLIKYKDQCVRRDKSIRMDKTYSYSF